MSYQTRSRVAARKRGATGNPELGLIYSHDFEDGAFPAQGGVIPGPLSDFITASTTNPISGTRSLNFAFGATPQGTHGWQEHNVALPKCYGGFGMEWDTRFSSNFVLRPDWDAYTGTWTGLSTTKWFQFWQQSDANFAVTPRTRSDYGGIFLSGVSIRRTGVGNRIEIMVAVTEDHIIGGILSSALLMDPDNPASAPIKPGQVHNIKWRVKYSSGIATGDGHWELLVDNVPVYSNLAMNLWPYNGLGGRPPFFSWGYLMGYANGGFGVDTSVQWDNLRFYNQSTRWW